MSPRGPLAWPAAPRVDRPRVSTRNADGSKGPAAPGRPGDHDPRRRAVTTVDPSPCGRCRQWPASACIVPEPGRARGGSQRLHGASGSGRETPSSSNPALGKPAWSPDYSANATGTFRRRRPNLNPGTRRCSKLNFATKTLSSGANGQKADAASPFVRAVLIRRRAGKGTTSSRIPARLPWPLARPSSRILARLLRPPARPSSRIPARLPRPPARPSSRIPARLPGP